METDRREHLKNLLAQAQDLPKEERAAFFDQACPNDPALHAELRSLVDHYDQALHFVDSPAGTGLPQAANNDPLGLIGQGVTHYLITDHLGGGGMGVVYKAQDAKLERTVALKFLPLYLSTDPKAKQRLIQEAKAASALDHPNICTIYEIGEHDGRLFIAMAYYAGETLRAKIAQGPLPVAEALDYTMQIAEGLGRAHEAGIVHRDVKPANVMVTERGRVKVLDFGIAKVPDANLTQTGTTVGTVAYMSPEQARGEGVNHLSDLWSWGVVLYEVLTQRQPFTGDYQQAVIYRILHEPPEPLGSLRPDATPALAYIVEKALAKEPDMRYADMEAALDDLRAVQQGMGLPARPRPGAAGKVGWGTIVGAVVVAALLVMAAVFMVAGESKTQGPPASHRKITATGAAFMPELSPDGRFVAYLAYESETEQRVVVQELSGGNPITVLDECYECWNLRWLPDGSALSFSALLDPESAPGNFLVPRTGGALRRLDPYTTFFSWSPDGTKYAGASTEDKGIVIVEMATGEIVDRLELEVPFMWFRNLDWSPSGDRLLFVTHDEQLHYDLWTITVEGHRVQKVSDAPTSIFSPRWSADDEAIYYLLSQGGTEDLMKVSLDSRSGAATGPATAILTGLETDDSVSLSRDLERLVYARASITSHLWLLTLANLGTEPARARPLTTGTRGGICPSISPDGKTVAFNTRNIFVMPLEGGSPRQVTHSKSENRCPVWSPDGKILAFSSNEGGTYRPWTVRVEGGTPRPFTQTRISSMGRLVWAPGTHVLYWRYDNGDLYILDPDSAEGRPLLDNTSQALRSGSSPRYSPDGERIAMWRLGGASQFGLWTLQLDGGLGTLLRKGSLIPVGWSPDGEWIYVLERKVGETHIVTVHATTGETRLLTVLPEDLHRGLRSNVPDVSMTPDGRQFVFSVIQANVSDVMLVEGFDPTMR